MATAPGGRWASWRSPIGDVRDTGQRAGGDSRDRAVRAAAVPGCEGDGRARGALRDGHHPGDGHRVVLAAVRRRVLWRMRDRTCVTG